MRDIFTLFLHAIVAIIRLAQPGGLRAVVAESILLQEFALKSRAAVKVSMYEFEGKVVRYNRAVPAGVYEVTIKVKNSQPGGLLLI